MQCYKFIIIDSVNLAYRLFDKEKRTLLKTARGYIYSSLAKNFFETVENLKLFYLASEIILLFDNYNSKQELQETFEKGLTGIHAKREIKNSYKAHRLKETDEFYTTLDFIKYYYRIQKPQYHTVQIKKLEADDLVPSCLTAVVKEDTALLITNDMDWAIHLTDKIHYTPHDLYKPEGPQEFFETHEFYPTKEKITLYKTLFGDKSDNIEITYPDIPLSVRKEMFSTLQNTSDLLFISKDRYPFLENYISYIKEREPQLKMNEYLLTPIPISEEIFLSHYTTGRDSHRLQLLIEKALLLKTEVKKNTFKFGGW